MSNTYPVDIKNPHNLVVSKFRGTSFVHRGAKQQHYAITAMDRYGNESNVLQSNMEKRNVENELLPNDGVNLTLPKSLDEMDINYFIVESALWYYCYKNI